MKGRSSHAPDGATGTLVPVWKEILLDTDTPVSAFARLRGAPAPMRNAEFAFLLESAPAGGDTWARYTFLGTNPRGAWKLAGGVVQEWTPGLGLARRPPAGGSVRGPSRDHHGVRARRRAGARRVLGRRRRLLLVRRRALHREAAARRRRRACVRRTRCSCSRASSSSSTTFARRLAWSRRCGCRAALTRPTSTALTAQAHAEIDEVIARLRDGAVTAAARPRPAGEAGARDVPRTSARSSSPTSTGSRNTSSRATASRRCSRAASSFRTISTAPRCTARSARSIPRPTCTTSHSTASSSWGARPSCTCAWPTTR